ncbi:MAG: PhoD-like phosphatase N-terminal domain-containing protein, partial [Acidimicrobiales bacterium]
MSLSRRQFLGLLGAGAAAACTGGDDRGGPSTTRPRSTGTTAPGITGPDPPPVDLPGDPFTLGVASGDPTPDGVILWTRLLPRGGGPGGDVPLVWEVAADDAFNELVAADLVMAGADAAHTVHVDVTGLAPDRWYAYRFRAGSFTSPTGRTRTMPAAGMTPERLR